ncbi:hypothetical protein BV20DRAFT_976118, partial [Pilatotrama ljubarskyi]
KRGRLPLGHSLPGPSVRCGRLHAATSEAHPGVRRSLFTDRGMQNARRPRAGLDPTSRTLATASSPRPTTQSEPRPTPHVRAVSVLGAQSSRRSGTDRGSGVESVCDEASTSRGRHLSPNSLAPSASPPSALSTSAGDKE